MNKTFNTAMALITASREILRKALIDEYGIDGVPKWSPGSPSCLEAYEHLLEADIFLSSWISDEAEHPF